MKTKCKFCARWAEDPNRKWIGICQTDLQKRGFNFSCDKWKEK